MKPFYQIITSTILCFLYIYSYYLMNYCDKRLYNTRAYEYTASTMAQAHPQAGTQQQSQKRLVKVWSAKLPAAVSEEAV